MKFTFATLPQAQKLMSTSDDYTRSLNTFNLDWANKSTTEKELLDKCANACLEWQEGEKDRAFKIIRHFQSLVRKNGMEIDQEIILIKTDGSDCNGLPYTRENFIVFPSTCFSRNEGPVSSILDSISLGLLVHETFHIISRKNPQLKPELYHLTGFNYPMNFEQTKYLPPTLVTNPDALNHDYTIEVTHANQKFLGMPIFEGFGKGVKLLLFNEQGKYQRIVKSKRTDYTDRIRAVSGYIIHPEEILAEFFRVCLTSKDCLEMDCQNFLDILRKHFPVKEEKTPVSV